MKHRLTAFFAACMTAFCCLPHAPASAEENEAPRHEEKVLQFGEHITGEYDEETKTMTLTGKGDMYDFSQREWMVFGVEKAAEHIVIGDGITSIGDCAFYYWYHVKELTVPDSVTRIGKHAFHMMAEVETLTLSKNLRVLDEDACGCMVALKALTLPDGLESIGASCFSYCPALEELNVPDSVTYIGKNGMPNHSAWLKTQQKKGDYLILGDGILWQYYGSDTAVTVPEGVKMLASSALTTPLAIQPGNGVVMNVPNPDVTSVSLPDSLTRIGEEVFAGMKNLQSVTLPPHLTHIDAGAFKECESLADIRFPDTLQVIGESAFYNCKQLADLQFPESVKEVGKYALDGTAWMEAQDGLVIFGGECLYRSAGRDKIIDIPETVRRISGYAFSGNKIMEIRIPETVEAIADDAVNCKYAVIAGKKGSAAEEYAKVHGLSFRDVHAPAPAGKDMTLDLTKDIWGFGNSGKVFGGAYFLTDADRKRLTENGYETKSTDTAWFGSCVGLSITVILAKNGVVSPAQLQAGAKTLSEITPDETVRSFINYYQCTQGDDRKSRPYVPEEQKLFQMIQTAKNIPHGESPFLLTFATGSSSHGVVGYGQEDGAWEFDGKTYDGRILVWDSNSPDGLRADSCLYYDSHTLDYCIPHYGVHVSDGAADNTAGIITVCGDLAVLNAYPHPLAERVTGDINGDRQLTVADAVLMARICAEDTAVQNAQPQDVDGDGYITVTDVTELLKMLAGTAS